MNTQQDVTRPRSRLYVPAVATLAAIAVVIFTADQLLKQLVVTNMVEGERILVFGEALQWLFVRNPGAAFSLASGQTWILTGVATAVVVVVIVLSRKIRSFLWAIVFGLVLGGAFGNLFDRLFREPGFAEGHVIDYIYTPWMMPAVYNLADMAIVGGMIAFVLLTLFDVGLDGQRRRRKASEAVASEAVATETEASDSDIVEQVAGESESPSAAVKKSDSE